MKRSILSNLCGAVWGGAAGMVVPGLAASARATQTKNPSRQVLRGDDAVNIRAGGAGVMDYETSSMLLLAREVGPVRPTPKPISNLQ